MTRNRHFLPRFVSRWWSKRSSTTPTGDRDDLSTPSTTRPPSSETLGDLAESKNRFPNRLTHRFKNPQAAPPSLPKNADRADLNPEQDITGQPERSLGNATEEARSGVSEGGSFNWLDRLRPKQLEEQLANQFTKYRQQLTASTGETLENRFEQILGNLPKLPQINRTEIEKRFESFARNAKPEDIGKILQRLPDMNRGPIRELWPKVRSLMEMIRDPDAAWAGKALAIGALIYLISPFDAIPDLIPFGGLADDAALIIAVVATLARELDRYGRQSMQAHIEMAEKLAEIEVQKYNRIVRLTLLGSIITAALTILVKIILSQ